jgi:hypothetical protein
MKTRLIRNWRTTALGILLLVITSVLLFLKILTGGEFIALLPTIIALLLSPDTILKNVTRDA